MSLGVKVTLNVCAAPAFNTVPLAGMYANVPARELPLTPVAVAFNGVALNAVPYVMSAGFGHASVGVALFTVTLTVLDTVVYVVVSVGVNVTE